MRIEEVIDLIRSDSRKDLHIHTVFSDGVRTPEEIVDEWEEKGFGVIAITDHDGIGGSVVALDYAADRNIAVIPGIEFDSDNILGRDLHILGYGIDLDNELLKSKLSQILEWRNERNARIGGELAKLGYPLTEEEIFEVNQGRYVGKPTFAKALVKKYDFASISEVFDKLFNGDEVIKNIDKTALASEDVVKTIHAAGGIAVLAHPMEQMKTGESWEHFEPRLLKILDTFVGYGIDGIECYHPSASEENAEYLRRYAKAHELLVTTGSDFHYDGLKRKYTQD